MLPILIILAFGVLYVHDGLPHPFLEVGADPRAVIIGAVSPMVTLIGALWLAVLFLDRRLDRAGRFSDAMLAEKLVAYSRVAALFVHASAVLAMGLPRAVRSVLGDHVFLDELVCLIPVSVAWFAGWWIIYPVERRLREAVVLRHLESGRPVYPFPRRMRYTWVSFRTQVLFFFLPLAGLMAWTEFSTLAILRLPEAWRAEWREPALATLAHLAGIAMVLFSMPLALRFVWDTAPLGDSPLTRRLLALCAEYRVRVRRLLVWRTDGVIVNGAVVGVVRPFRYILLTDALLDQLSTRQIEAVMAHEVAHVRCRHMLWLAVCVLATILGTGVIADLVLHAAGQAESESLEISAAVTFFTFGTLFLTFGAASRIFERQADTFAARHMSVALPKPAGHTPASQAPASQAPASQAPASQAPMAAPVIIAPEGLLAAAADLVAEPASQASIPPEMSPSGSTPSIPDAPDGRFTFPGVASMADALRNVAALNGISPSRFTWRHGSIAQRITHLESLLGTGLEQAPIDRRARFVKRASLLTLILSVVAIILL